ncbi:MAG: cysteine desulfurase [Chloroflexi bacterium]|nr:cysteine desulfurase [Chloroflexota bacterium]
MTVHQGSASRLTADGQRLDVSAVRSDFPILSRMIRGKPLVYLDSTATSQKPAAVIDALADFYRTSNANVHRGVYSLSEESTAAYELTRQKVAAFIGAPSLEQIIFTRNTTESLNLVAFAWGRANLHAGDEVLVTQMEHHSNIVPWQIVCQERGAVLRFVPVTEDGTLDLSNLDSLLTNRTKVFAFTQMSNVLGTINPVAELVRRAKAMGAITVIDGAQGAPHLKVDMAALGADFYAFSAHKMLGPTGVGVLYGNAAILDSMGPFLGGGEMIDEVHEDHFTWKAAPLKFEAGTPNFADVAAFGAAIDYLSALGMERVRQHEIQLTRYALDEVRKLGDSIRVFGPPDTAIRGGVLSFGVEGVHPHDIAQVMDWDAICIRAGHHCAQPLMRRLQVPATARASFYIYTTEQEIDTFVNTLKKVGEYFTNGPRV